MKDRTEQNFSPSRPELDPELWKTYRGLPYELRNEFCLRVLQDNLSNQKYLLYGWPVQQLYSRYANDFLTGRTDLRILEIGPGDNLMTTALWMLEPRVAKLTLLDKYKGQYVEKANYHAQMIDLIQTLLFLPHDTFNNYYPFETLNIEMVRKAIRFNEDGSITLNPARAEFRLIEDFTKFPFGSGEFDYVYSHATLEHLTDPPSSIVEMYRVLSPGGLMVHQIDIRDHRNFDDPFRYLEIPSEEWNFGDLGFPVNQWRVHQFRKTFLDAGFTSLGETKVRREPEKLKGVTLAPEFANINQDDLSVTGVVFVLRKDG